MREPFNPTEKKRNISERKRSRRREGTKKKRRGGAPSRKIQNEKENIWDLMVKHHSATTTRARVEPAVQCVLVCPSTADVRRCRRRTKQSKLAKEKLYYLNFVNIFLVLQLLLAKGTFYLFHQQAFDFQIVNSNSPLFCTVNEGRRRWLGQYLRRRCLVI